MTIRVFEDWIHVFVIWVWGSVYSSLFVCDHISVGASTSLFGLLRAMPYGFITNGTICSNKVILLTLGGSWWDFSFVSFGCPVLSLRGLVPSFISVL
ncbi:RHOMBOID protein 3 [Spatholobus suberectus]|nr:RHOMBOID protein 3 [Spatholobus suberectus]